MIIYHAQKEYHFTTSRWSSTNLIDTECVFQGIASSSPEARRGSIGICVVSHPDTSCLTIICSCRQLRID